MQIDDGERMDTSVMLLIDLVAMWGSMYFNNIKTSKQMKTYQKPHPNTIDVM